MLDKEKLLELRIESGKLQKECAAEVGVTPAAWMQYESEKYSISPTLSTMAKIAKMFNVKIDDLVKEDEI